jgi:regulatory protein
MTSTSDDDQPTILSLRVRGRRQMIEVELSDGRVLSLKAETVLQARLAENQTLTAEKIAALAADSAQRLAVEAALNFVSYRPRSQREVADHLRSKRFDAQAIDYTLQRLTELGYLDDLAFARFWIENRDTFRPKGRLALVWELEQKGLDRATIEHALSQWGGDERVLIREAAHHKARTLPGDDPATFKRKLADFLSRRGFAYELVEEIVEEAWREREKGRS